MIKLENISKTIKGRTVLSDINITFRKGATYGLKGINGSGKTMLMRLVAGLIFPSTGTVTVAGRRLGHEISFPEKVGILIESPAFLNAYTGVGNLKLLAALNGEVTDDTLRETLLRVGLDPDDKRKYRKYSLGMKQRLGIAAAIMETPDILVLDEPLNALDAAGTALFTDIIRKEKERDTLILLSCHDDKKLLEYSDVIVTLEDGQITDFRMTSQRKTEGAL